jgi:DNA-binding response OmpR family regulator
MMVEKRLRPQVLVIEAGDGKAQILNRCLLSGHIDVILAVDDKEADRLASLQGIDLVVCFRSHTDTAAAECARRLCARRPELRAIILDESADTLRRETDALPQIHTLPVPFSASALTALARFLIGE